MNVIRMLLKESGVTHEEFVGLLTKEGDGFVERFEQINEIILMETKQNKKKR